MSTVFQITRAFIFLVLASFASTALSITVNAESGSASLNGTWAFPGCNLDLEDYDSDYEEHLIFQDDTVEARITQYVSSNRSCSGVGTIVESESFNFSATGEQETEGWLGENVDGDEVPVPPPPRQDGNGLLDPTPLATVLAILIPGEGGEEDETETGLWYMDDTSLTWYLYRNAGEDDDPLNFMSVGEPLLKTDLAIGPIPVPAAFWLFGTALIGFIGMSRRIKVA